MSDAIEELYLRNLKVDKYISVKGNNGIRIYKPVIVVEIKVPHQRKRRREKLYFQLH